MEGVSGEELAELCASYESALANTFDGGALPPDWAEALAGIGYAGVRPLLARFALLKHYSILRHEQMASPAVDPADAQQAALQLLHREPVAVRLASGREVYLTGRSYAALYEISSRWNRIRLLEEELTRCGELEFHLEQQQRGVGFFHLGPIRRRRRRVAEAHSKIFRELFRQRERLYASLFTRSGAPAGEHEPAPSWWLEIAPDDEGALMVAAAETGPARLARLGEAPSRSEKRAAREEWGWSSFFSSLEKQRKVEPGALFDADLYQLLAWVRTSDPGTAEDLDG